jgi:hypothetical protein
VIPLDDRRRHLGQIHPVPVGRYRAADSGIAWTR